MSDITRVALDAMGGDNAPSEIVKGAVEAVQQRKDILILLTGQEEVLKKELSQYTYPKEQIRIVNASEVIETAEPPVKAIRGKKDSSIVVAMKLVKDGGFLATCSCSHFMDYELFTQTIGQAARNVHKRLRQVEYRTQSPDHPILWAADESYYLKFYIFQVREEY